jgi:hypothetical protein
MASAKRQTMAAMMDRVKAQVTDQNHDRDEVIDHLIDHGQLRAGVPLFKPDPTIEYGWRLRLAVPRTMKGYWRINHVDGILDFKAEHPVAYRRDGVQVWASFSIDAPFAVYDTRYERIMGYGKDDWTFEFVETAMKAADELWPCGSRIPQPWSISRAENYKWIDELPQGGDVFIARIGAN